MITLGLDTSTPSTAVALLVDERELLEARDDPPPGAHPGHTTRLLALAAELLAQAQLGWSDVTRIAAGVGPGTFTGLRVGLATARGLAQSLAAELVGVSSLRALAEGAGERAVLAMIDARRGEVFAAAYVTDGHAPARQLLAPRALAHGELAGLVAGAQELEGNPGTVWHALGDGAVRYGRDLRALGARVASDGSPLHRVSAGTICHIGARARRAEERERLLPEYCRRPDAELALERAEAERASRMLEGAGR